MSKPHERPQSAEEQARPLVEWITFSISLGLLLLLVGLLSYDYFTNEDEPAELEVRPALEAVVQRGERYYLPVWVSNTGHDAAGSVQVTLKLVVGGEEVEQSALAVGFLAGQDEAEAAAVFNHDPRLGELVVELGFVRR